MAATGQATPAVNGALDSGFRASALSATASRRSAMPIWPRVGGHAEHRGVTLGQCCRETGRANWPGQPAPSRYWCSLRRTLPRGGLLLPGQWHSGLPWRPTRFAIMRLARSAASVMAVARPSAWRLSDQQACLRPGQAADAQRQGHAVPPAPLPGPRRCDGPSGGARPGAVVGRAGSACRLLLPDRARAPVRFTQSVAGVARVHRIALPEPGRPMTNRWPTSCG